MNEPMLLDRLLPRYDTTRVEHRLIPGDIEKVYEATRQADFTRAWRESLAGMPTHGDWVLLGEDRPREIAFGVIGRFWGGEAVREEIDAADFVSYWRQLSPFIGVVMRSQLHVVAHEAAAHNG